MMRTVDLGPVGIWLSRAIPAPERARLAVCAEQLGWGAVWLSGGMSRGVLDDVRVLLDATETITVAPSILNMWADSPAETTDAYHALERDHPGRVLLGVGPSHAPTVERFGLGEYVSPIAKSREYIAELAAQPQPVPPQRLLLSALGPLALQLAASSTAGSIPYLTVPAHTTFAREALGSDPFLAPELGVVMTQNRDEGRHRARQFLEMYLEFSNYTTTLTKFGFTADDLARGGSDSLIDALFGIGDLSEIVSAINAHRIAGADHVAVQVLALDAQDPVDVMKAIDAAMNSESEDSSPAS
jgi:probable F420-dependent oxidoreductase